MSKINTDPLESFVELTSNSLFIKKKITLKGRSSQSSLYPTTQHDLHMRTKNS